MFQKIKKKKNAFELPNLYIIYLVTYGLYQFLAKFEYSI